jgi:hypothetical protein
MQHWGARSRWRAAAFRQPSFMNRGAGQPQFAQTGNRPISDTPIAELDARKRSFHELANGPTTLDDPAERGKPQYRQTGLGGPSLVLRLSAG